MNSAQPVADEYRSLGPLQTRILTHQRHSERPNDPDLDVLRALRLSPAEGLLDVGSGTGEFLRRLRAEGHTGRLCAIDASQAAVDAAGAVQGVEALRGDAQALPYPDASFDAVTARHMLYHVPDPVLAIEQARRVLRAGGRFAAVVNIRCPMPLINASVDAVLDAHGIERPGPPTRPCTRATCRAWWSPCSARARSSRSRTRSCSTSRSRSCATACPC